MKIHAMIQKPASINMTKNEPTNEARRLTVLTFVLAIGILSGVLLYLTNRTAFLNELPDAILTAASFNRDAPFLKRFFCRVLATVPFFLCLVVSGACVFGIWLVYPILYLKSAGIGALACTYIQSFQMQGISRFYLTVFPGFCGLFYTLLLMGQNCIYTSYALRNGIQKEGTANKHSIMLFLMRSLVVFGILMLSLFLNTLLDTVLSGVSIAVTS